MGNTWHWTAGYVQSKTQAELARAVQSFVETTTNGRCQLVCGEALAKRMYDFGVRSTFACVSPQENGWTAFWHSSEVFCWWVFQTQKLSGILFGGFGEINIDDGYLYENANSWNYIIWESGGIIDWFISNPRYKFWGWGAESLERFVVPYLQSKGRAKTIAAPKESLIRALINEHVGVWAGDVDSIGEFSKPSVSTSEIVEWLALATVPALYKIPEILEIPFAGLDYNSVDVATFLNRQRGLPSHGVLRALEPGVRDEDLYRRSPEWMDQVSRFKPLLFEITETSDKVSQLEVLNEFGHLFFYL